MKIIIGKVISTKMQKTATVLVERMVIHPLYQKRYTKEKKYQVHDDLGVKVGQMVKFVASRPYSKNIKWKTVEVFEKGKNTKKRKVKKWYN